MLYIFYRVYLRVVCTNIGLRGRCGVKRSVYMIIIMCKHVGIVIYICGGITAAVRVPKTISFEVSPTGLCGGGGVGHRQEPHQFTGHIAVLLRRAPYHYISLIHRRERKKKKNKKHKHTHVIILYARIERKELHLLPRGHRSRKTKQKRSLPRRRTPPGRGAPSCIRVHRNYNPCRPTVMT